MIILKAENLMGFLACLEKKKCYISKTTHQANQMAGSRIWHNPHCNFLPVGKDELAGGISTNGIDTFASTSIITIFCVLIFALVFVLVSFKTICNNIDLQKILKLALKLFV